MENEKVSDEQLEKFSEGFRIGLSDLLELLEVSCEDPLAIDPYSMGIDERNFEQLSAQEKAEAEKLIYEMLGLETENLSRLKTREYVSETSGDATIPGEIKVSVFNTNIEGVYLQELVFADGEKRFVLGPDKNI